MQKIPGYTPLSHNVSNGKYFKQTLWNYALMSPEPSNYTANALVVASSAVWIIG
jgi:hypothetical protein